MNLASWLRVLSKLEREYDGEDTLTARIERAREYVDERLHRADIVDELPNSAAAGRFLVSPGSTSLFIGQGPARPLREIPTQPRSTA